MRVTARTAMRFRAVSKRFLWPACRALWRFQLAPTVASWILGDRTGAAVEKVTGIARDILGTDDPSGIEAAIARDPNAALQFKTALIQAEADARRLEHEAVLAQIHDVQSARYQTVRLAEAKSPIA